MIEYLLNVPLLEIRPKGYTSKTPDFFIREKAKAMFYHGYNGYLQHAYPYDELKPISCVGHDTWGR